MSCIVQPVCFSWHHCALGQLGQSTERLSENLYWGKIAVRNIGVDSAVTIRIFALVYTHRATAANSTLWPGNFQGPIVSFDVKLRQSNSISISISIYSFNIEANCFSRIHRLIPIGYHIALWSVEWLHNIFSKLCTHYSLHIARTMILSIGLLLQSIWTLYLKRQVYGQDVTGCHTSEQWSGRYRSLLRPPFPSPKWPIVSRVGR